MRENPEVKLTANSEMTLGPKSASVFFFLKSSVILMVINEQSSILTIGLN